MKLDNILGRIDNYLFFNPIMKKTKRKKCKNCIYFYKNGNVCACNKGKYYIEPLKLICFKKKDR